MRDTELKTPASSESNGPFTAAISGRVSVIIPAYNAASTIERTISSVLNQSYSDLEVLVVDDGSIDETPVLVRRMAHLDSRIRVLHKTNGGLVSARNHGIAHASGEFIAPLDADDLWHPEKIMKQVLRMRHAGDQVGLVYTWGRGIDEQGRILFDLTPYRFQGDVYAVLVLKNFVSSGAPLVRRKCGDEIGWYDASLSGRGATCCEDFKFCLDIAERYHFDVVPEFLLGYRFRAGSMSTNSQAMLRSHELVLRDARPRHPELPEKLFRWSRAHQDLEFGLAYLGAGRFLTAGPLLFNAVWQDLPGTLHWSLQRVPALIERSGRLAELRRDWFPKARHRALAGRDFFEADPGAFCSRPRSQLSRRRLAYIAKLQARAVTRSTAPALA